MKLQFVILIFATFSCNNASPDIETGDVSNNLVKIDGWENNIYRNKNFGFRIVFPAKWDYDNGTAAYTLARAFLKEKAAVISVVVVPIKKSTPDPNNIFELGTENDIRYNYLNNFQKNNVRNVNIERGWLDNFPAYIVTMTSTISAGVKTQTQFTKTVECLKGGNYYTVVINIAAHEWSPAISNLFDGVVESFVFDIDS